MKRLKRPELVEQIIKIVNLPPGKVTSGYFTTEQLMELRIKLDALIKSEEISGKTKESLHEQINT